MDTRSDAAAEVICQICDQPFKNRSRGTPAVVCSDDCRAELGRRRARAWHAANYKSRGRRRVPATCTVPGCNKPNNGAGLCSMHRRRLSLHGTLESPPLICARCGQPTGRNGVSTRRAFCAKCRPIAQAEQNQEWKAKNPDKLAVLRERAVLARYGLTPETRDRILLEQGGACPICAKPYVVAQRRWWHVDHDHETGQVRGILCHRCNQDIGRFRDDPVLLRAAADYLVRARLAPLQL